MTTTTFYRILALASTLILACFVYIGWIVYLMASVPGGNWGVWLSL